MERSYLCPHCQQNTILEGEEWELDYNCPVLTCPSCNNEFLKEGCKEIAISNINLDDRLPISIWALGICLVGILLLLTSFHFSNSVMIFRPKNLIFGIIVILMGLTMAVSGIKNFKKKCVYFKIEKEKSKTRCANLEYTTKLETLGYKKK